MLTLPEGRPKQAEKFGVRNEEVAIKAYVAWRKEEAEIPGCGTSVLTQIGMIEDHKWTFKWISKEVNHPCRQPAATKIT